MGQADLDINRKARMILVRHWIDLGFISLRSSNGRLTIRGSLAKIFGQKEELTPPAVESMFNDIKRIPGVTRVQTEIENWTNSGGLWQPIKKDKAKDYRQSGGTGDEKATYVIEDE